MWKKRSRTQFAFDAEKVFLAATQPLAAVYGYFRTTPSGLSSDEVERRQAQYGRNEVEHERRKNPVTMFIRAFINPFIGILTLLIVVSYVLDVWMAAPEEKEWTTILIIATMILLSVIIRFCQDWRASRSSEALRKMVKNTCSVKRAGREVEELPIEELVPGDIVTLAAGDMIPADVRVIETKDLFVSQSSLTGESEPIEKRPDARGRKYVRGSVVELDNICYMGSNVISGSATAIVFGTGDNTYLGTIARAIVGHRAATAFDRGIARVSLLLIRFMLIMVPFVFLVNGITKGDWLEAFIFAVSVAVGLTPEMLPMIVTANLSKGAVSMSRKKVIVKDLNAIQNFGAMNILCTDKTGTLTCDQIVLERYINADGSADDSRRILRHAYFNSFFQTGLKNLMDRAILAHVRELELESMKDDYRKVDEIPFDFTRRRMSVVVEDRTGKRQIVTKGAVEEMLEICSYTEEGGAVRELTPERIATAKAICERMNHQGLRVLAVAHRSFLGKEDNFSVGDERDMVLIGFLAFLDPPKPSAESAIRQLQNYGIEVKVLSGDNDAVVRTVARQVGITGKALTGRELEELEGEELRRAVQEASVFSKVTPLQKTQIITLLQEAQHTVGFLGDGINDAAAQRRADLALSLLVGGERLGGQLIDREIDRRGLRTGLGHTLKGLRLVGGIALDRIDQIGDQVRTTLVLRLNVRPRRINGLLLRNEPVVRAEDEDRDDDDDGDPDPFFHTLISCFYLIVCRLSACYHFEPAPPPPKLPPPNEPPMLPPPMPPKPPPPMIIPPPGPPKRLPRSERTRRRTVAPHDEQT